MTLLKSIQKQKLLNNNVHKRHKQAPNFWADERIAACVQRELTRIYPILIYLTLSANENYYRPTTHIQIMTLNMGNSDL